MLFPILLFVPFVVLAAVFWYLLRRPGAGGVQRTGLGLGLAIGSVRAAVACVGWYGVEHAGGPLQIPAYLMAMAAWPEAGLAPRWIHGSRVLPATPALYLRLSVLLMLTTVVLVSATALLAERMRSRRRADLASRGTPAE